MYIAKLANKEAFIVKRMPKSGQSHHTNCSSFEVPDELSGRGALEDNAIVEDDSTGLTNLKLDFSLSKIPGKSPVQTEEDNKKTTIESDPSKLTLRSLLHCLYEDSGLNRWVPNMESKRNWYVVRKNLMEAVNAKLVKGKPLSNIVLMPETFSMEKKDIFSAQRRKFLSSLKPQGKKKPVGILIGEVKSFESARFNKKLVIKHMGDVPIYYGEDIQKQIDKHFSQEISMFEENEKIHLLTIATFIISPSGNPTIDSMSFITVDANWLPFDGIDEFDLVSRAVREKRHFIKGLRYNLAPQKVIASILLSDTGEKPTAFYLVPMDAPEGYFEDLKNIVDESEFESSIYDINKDEPLSLPPSKKTPETEEQQVQPNNVPPQLSDVPPQYNDVPDYEGYYIPED